MTVSVAPLVLALVPRLVIRLPGLTVTNRRPAFTACACTVTVQLLIAGITPAMPKSTAPVEMNAPRPQLSVNPLKLNPGTANGTAQRNSHCGCGWVGQRKGQRGIVPEFTEVGANAAVSVGVSGAKPYGQCHRSRCGLVRRIGLTTTVSVRVPVALGVAEISNVQGIRWRQH